MAIYLAQPVDADLRRSDAPKGRNKGNQCTIHCLFCNIRVRRDGIARHLRSCPGPPPSLPRLRRPQRPDWLPPRWTVELHPTSTDHRGRLRTCFRSPCGTRLLHHKSRVLRAAIASGAPPQPGPRPAEPPPPRPRRPQLARPGPLGEPPLSRRRLEALSVGVAGRRGPPAFCVGPAGQPRPDEAPQGAQGGPGAPSQRARLACRLFAWRRPTLPRLRPAGPGGNNKKKARSTDE